MRAMQVTHFRYADNAIDKAERAWNGNTSNDPEDIMIDRQKVNQALAKAIAYKNCNKDQDAREWARTLVRLLECADILAYEASQR